MIGTSAVSQDTVAAFPRVLRKSTREPEEKQKNKKIERRRV